MAGTRGHYRDVYFCTRMVKEGDHVAMGDEVCEVQSDKVGRL